jgi:hypothetical protein
MKRAALLLLSFLSAGTARAAEITRTLEAFEPTKPWGANVDIEYSRTLRRALISREKPEADQTRYFDDKELRYSRIDHEMNFRFRFAIYRDLELYLNLPVVLSRSQFVGLALSGGDAGAGRTGGCSGPGAPTGDSSIVRDGLFRGGGISSSPDPNLTQQDPQNLRAPNPARTILGQAGITPPVGTGQAGPTGAGCYLGEPGVPAETMRSGFGDMSIGIAWAPYNNDRDETRPTWLLKLEYTLPTGTTMDPTPADPAHDNYKPKNDTVGFGMHVLTFQTYLSKRVNSFFDPYIGFEYSAYFPADNPIFRRLNVTLPTGEVVSNQEHLGPGQRAGVVAGFEIIPWERLSQKMKFAIDFRLRARANFEGRDYSEIADFLGRVTDIETYATFEASVGFYLQITKWFLLKMHLGLATDTKHFITFANIGTDRNGSRTVENTPTEQNPVYDPLTDQVGRRLSVSETTVFNWGFSLIAMF